MLSSFRLLFEPGIVIRELARATFIVVFLLVQTVSSDSGANVVDVVVHSAVTSRVLSRNTLRAIFGMRLHRWADGTPIRVFVLQDDSSVHNAFCKQRLQIFPHQLRRNWDRLVFSGIGQAPFLVYSEEEMLEKVAGTSGAIGYLDREKVDDSVRILTVR